MPSNTAPTADQPIAVTWTVTLSHSTSSPFHHTYFGFATEILLRSRPWQMGACNRTSSLHCRLALIHSDEKIQSKIGRHPNERGEPLGSPLARPYGRRSRIQRRR